MFYVLGYVYIPLEFIQLFIDYTKTSKSEFLQLFGVKKWGLFNLVKLVLKSAKKKSLKKWGV